MPARFDAFEFERDDFTAHLYGHAEARSVELTTILGVLDEMYGRVRKEHLGDALDQSNLTILMLYAPEGVWALEDHDHDQLEVQVKTSDYDSFVQAVDEAFSPENYRELGIDPQVVVDVAP